MVLSFYWFPGHLRECVWLAEYQQSNAPTVCNLQIKNVLRRLFKLPNAITEPPLINYRTLRLDADKFNDQFGSKTGCFNKTVLLVFQCPQLAQMVHGLRNVLTKRPIGSKLDLDLGSVRRPNEPAPSEKRFVDMFQIKNLFCHILSNRLARENMPNFQRSSFCRQMLAVDRQTAWNKLLDEQFAASSEYVELTIRNLFNHIRWIEYPVDPLLMYSTRYIQFI